MEPQDACLAPLIVVGLTGDLSDGSTKYVGSRLVLRNVDKSA